MKLAQLGERTSQEENLAPSFPSQHSISFYAALAFSKEERFSFEVMEGMWLLIALCSSQYPNYICTLRCVITGRICLQGEEVLAEREGCLLGGVTNGVKA